MNNAQERTELQNANAQCQTEAIKTTSFVEECLRAKLLLLFRVHRVLTELRAVLFELQLLTARFAADRVVVIARLVTNEENRFNFFLALGHDQIPTCAFLPISELIFVLISGPNGAAKRLPGVRKLKV